jgi:hypothetical protein
MFLLSMLLAATLSNADATLFAERLADLGYGPAPVVTIGALPSTWTSRTAPTISSAARQRFTSQR